TAPSGEPPVPMTITKESYSGEETNPDFQPPSSGPSSSVTPATPTSSATLADPKPGDIPLPGNVGNVSGEAIRANAFRYFQTGKFPSGMNSKVYKPQREAIENDAAAIAKSYGMTVQEMSDMWQYSPRRAAFLTGIDGRQIGSLGTVVDHLDTLRS